MEVRLKDHRSRNRSTALLLRASLSVVIFLLLCAQWTREPLRAAPSIQADPYWSLTPDPLTIVGCEVVPVTVRINDVTNLYGADVIVSFDPTILEVVDADGNSGNGIQVENAGMLSGRIFVARNEANNTTGTARYAVTLLNPAPPVTGSGDFIRIYFRAKAAGTSPLHFSYFKLAETGGVEIPSTAVDGSAITTAPNAAAVTISRLNSTTARLSWPTVTGVDGYHIYRDTIPYFTPTGTPYATVAAGPYDDVGALGNIATNYFYVIRSACTNGFESVNSNRVGEFDYELRETASTDYNWIALPLDAGLNTAASLKTHIEGNSTSAVAVSAVETWNSVPQSYLAYYPALPFTNFALRLGGAYRVNVDVASGTSTIWSLVGSVPGPDVFTYTFYETASSDYNWLMLPLNKEDITSASVLESNIETYAVPGASVLTIERWNSTPQSFGTYYPMFPFTNFSTRVGYPYRISVDVSSASQSVWP